MALQLWHTLKEAIHAYTGLSPVVFFTALALAFAIYQVISGWFASPFDDVHRHQRARSLAAEQEPPTPQPVQVGEITEEELKQYDGSDPQKPLLMAIKHQIYDVTQSRMFYGPGGPYALFAGKDASRALAKMSFEEKDLTWDISGLGPFELEALQDWEYKFMSKYAKVGTVKVAGSQTETASVSESAETSGHVATPEKTGDHVTTPEKTGDHATTPEKTGDHATTPEKTGDHATTPEKTTPEKTGDHATTPEKTVEVKNDEAPAESDVKIE